MNYGSAVISSGASTSTGITLGGNTTITGIKIPAAMTNTAIKVQGKFFEADDWNDVYYNGVLVSVPATVDTKQKFLPGSMFGLHAVRFVGTGVGNEASDRTIVFAHDGIV